MPHRASSTRNGTQSQDDAQSSSHSSQDRLPDTITAGGRTRTVTQHAIDDTHPGITAEFVAYVLENWVIRGIKTDPSGRQSMCHWAYVLDLGKMVRVAVSLDDRRIITAFPDSAATRSWSDGRRDFFDGRCENWEERNES